MYSKRSMVERACLQCGAPFRAKWSAIERGEAKFCSRTCAWSNRHERAGDPIWRRVERGEHCWLWQGPRDGSGYGSAKIHGRQHRVHRVCWEQATGLPIPAGMMVCHTCDIPICVRNDDAGIYEVEGVEYERRGHLWLGTNDANMADMRLKGRARSRPRIERVPGPWRAYGDANGSRQHPERLRRGEQVNTAKLTAAQVVEIRQRKAAGERAIDLAAEYGVHKNLIWLIASRRVWAHI